MEYVIGIVVIAVAVGLYLKYGRKGVSRTTPGNTGTPNPTPWPPQDEKPL